MAKHKKGDTLIEVMLAIGIFSMVAIAVTSVISGSTSSAQTALEATLTREEIDAQAEALRFIQAAYISDTSGNYADLWEKITESNNVITDNITDIIAGYPPNTCDVIYSGDNSIFQTDANKDKKAFVINTRALGELGSLSTDSPTYGSDKADAINKIYITARDHSEEFTLAATYPHLRYDNDAGSLISDPTSTELVGAEGIYVMTVAEDVAATATPGYYDFYIRTCWYGTGDRNASTISTVIRLYNPAVIQPADI